VDAEWKNIYTWYEKETGLIYKQTSILDRRWIKIQTTKGLRTSDEYLANTHCYTSLKFVISSYVMKSKSETNPFIG